MSIISLQSQIMPIIERNFDYKQIILLSSSFVCIILWAIIKWTFKSYFSGIYIDVFRDSFQKNLKILESNKNFFVKIIILIATVLSLSSAVASVFFYHPMFEEFIYNPFKIFFFILIFFLIIILIILFGLRILGYIFDFDKHFNYYSGKSFNISIILSIAIFPLYIILPYIDNTYIEAISIIILGLFIAALLFKFIVLFYYLKEIKFLNVYSFLYFCTAEILPVIFLFKVTKGFIR